jgi:hypothetical protein
VTIAISTGGASPALARKLRETLSGSSDLDWTQATSVLSKARQIVKDKQVAVDPQRWQCCMTPELLSLAKSGRDDEAVELLIDGLMGKDSNGKCSNIAECVSGGCQIRNDASLDTSLSTDDRKNQGRMAQTAGD